VSGCSGYDFVCYLSQGDDGREKKEEGARQKLWADSGYVDFSDKSALGAGLTVKIRRNQQGGYKNKR
jgi:hypothetical protein